MDGCNGGRKQELVKTIQPPCENFSAQLPVGMEATPLAGAQNDGHPGQRAELMEPGLCGAVDSRGALRLPLPLPDDQASAHYATGAQGSLLENTWGCDFSDEVVSPFHSLSDAQPQFESCSFRVNVLARRLLRRGFRCSPLGKAPVDDPPADSGAVSLSLLPLLP